jgi:hypothetical protein
LCSFASGTTPTTSASEPPPNDRRSPTGERSPKCRRASASFTTISSAVGDENVRPRTNGMPTAAK